MKKMYGILKRTVKRIVKKAKAMGHFLCFFAQLYLGPGNRIYLLGTPIHNNIGDSAIAYSEILFLRACGYEPFEITTGEYAKCEKRLLKRLDGKVICLHGGGNMGNLWPKEEILRRRILSSVKARSFIIFPQTFYYSNDESGRSMLDESKAYYNNPKVCIVARERKSFDLIKAAYPKADVMLTPDIVLSLTIFAGEMNRERENALLVFRNDVEKNVKDEMIEMIKSVISDEGMRSVSTDMLADVSIRKKARKEVVENKLLQFSRSRIVVTDRLHAMVFAALTGTPCIVMGNCNHKVYGVYEWIKHLDYIRFIDSIDQFKSAFRDVLSVKSNCKEIVSNDLFSPLKEKIFALSKES